MNPNDLFSVVNLLVLPQWLLMITAPRLRLTQWLMRTGAFPMALALVYAGHILAFWGVEGGGFGSLAAVKTLFTSDQAVLAGWVHYLAFDLLVGTWIVRDAESRNMPRIWRVPCLLLTFMFGPVGWFLYQLLMRLYPEPQAQS